MCLFCEAHRLSSSITILRVLGDHCATADSVFRSQAAWPHAPPPPEFLLGPLLRERASCPCPPPPPALPGITCRRPPLGRLWFSARIRDLYIKSYISKIYFKFPFHMSSRHLFINPEITVEILDKGRCHLL